MKVGNRLAVKRVSWWMALAVVVPALSVRAFVLAPMTMDFAPSGREASRTFHLENDGNESGAIQISVVKREMNANGQETLIPANEEFTVYPPQVILSPRQRQAVKVTWVGTSKPPKELAYRLIAEQLPVNLSKEVIQGGHLKLLTKYQAAIYVVPKGAKPELQLESVKEEVGPDGKRRLVMQFSNQGLAHVLLINLRLHLRSKSGDKETEVSLSSNELKEVTGQNVLAGSKRIFAMPWPAGLESGELTARFDIDSNP